MLISNKKSFIKSCRRQGYKYVEVAKVLGVSKQRVEQILRPQKQKARGKVQHSRLESKPCEYPNCGCLKTEAHHWDYSRPLDVVWLCKKHHEEYHKKVKVKKVKIRKCARCLKKLNKGRHKWCEGCAWKRGLKKRRIAYKSNPQRKARQFKANMNWRKNNPDKWGAIQKRAVKKYYELHKEQINEKLREKRRENKFVLAHNGI